MRLWQKLWLLFSVIWLVVAALQIGTLLAFSPDEPDKILWPAALALAVPAALYAALWLWEKLMGRKASS